MMKSRIVLALLAGVLFAFGGTTTVAAQSHDSTGRYDGQALRYESHLGRGRIIRGADGPLIGTVGWFSSFDVEKLVASSPSAQAEARVYKTNNFRGSVIASIGAATTVIGVAVTANSSNNAASPMMIIAGAGVIAWGAQHFKIAYSALSRSLWWYNRDIARASR
jgi:hypothetical protein